MSGSWAVDSISKYDSKRNIIRLVNFAEKGPGGIRYVLANDDCVDLVESEGNLEGNEFGFGRSYRLNHKELKKSKNTSTNVGNVKYMPEIDVHNLLACVTRDLETEFKLKESIESVVKNAKVLLGERSVDASPSGGVGKFKLKIYIVNVGQGDTIIIDYGGGELWMVDAFMWGSQKYGRFIEWFRNTFGRNLTRLIISHYHYDHIRSASAVINDLNPAEVVLPCGHVHQTGTVKHLLNNTDPAILRRLEGVESSTGQLYTVNLISTGSFPGTTRIGSDPNENAIATVIKFGESVALLSADIPGRLLKKLCEHSIFDGCEEYEKYYKVTHHCSRTGFDHTFLNTLRPMIAVTSCSSSNRYDHPHDPPRSNIDRIAREHKKTYQERGMAIEWILK